MTVVPTSFSIASKTLIATFRTALYGVVGIEAALRFPTNKEKAWQTLLVGGVLIVFLPGGLFLWTAMVVDTLGVGNNVGALLVIGAVAVSYIPLVGYLVRVLRVSGDREATAPAFSPVGSLLIDGLKGFVVGGVYLAIPYALLTVIALRILQSARQPIAVVRHPPPTVVALSAISGVLFVLALYLLPAALANFARQGRLSRGFALTGIADGALSFTYFKAFAVAVVIYWVGNLLSQALLFLLVGAFILFWTTVVAVYLTGRGFCQARGLDAIGGSRGGPPS